MGHTEIGIFLTHANDILGPEVGGLVDTITAIEDAGVDYVVVADHVVLGSDMEGHEALGAPLPYPPEEPYPDPLLTLAAAAAVTRRIRLATGILIVPLRPAVLLAKMVATLAAMSSGRFDLGVGTGWQRDEFAALGVPMEGKASRLDDAIGACRALWEPGPGSFASPTVSFDGLYCSPHPPSPVPIWYAGQPITATLRRVVSSGAGWLPLRCPAPEQLKRIRDDITRLCASWDRDPDSVGIRASLATHDTGRPPDFEDLGRRASALFAAGITGLHLNLRDLASTPEDLRAVLPRVAALKS